MATSRLQTNFSRWVHLCPHLHLGASYNTFYHWYDQSNLFLTVCIPVLETYAVLAHKLCANLPLNYDIMHFKFHLRTNQYTEHMFLECWEATAGLTMLFCLCCSSIIETWLTGGMPTTTDWTQDRSKRRRSGGKMVEVWGKKKGGEWRKGLPVRHAEFSGHRSSKGVDNRPRERRVGVETQADMPAPSGFTYLLLDVAVGDRDGAGRPVEEVLVGGDLTGLHRTTSTAQLLLRDTMKQQYVFFNRLMHKNRTFYQLYLWSQHALLSTTVPLHLCTH